jgi:hypothetical protein
MNTLINEKGFHPKQVFLCDEPGFSRKKMLKRTYVHKSANEAHGHKTETDRLTLAPCGNIAGNMIKPGME